MSIRKRNGRYQFRGRNPDGTQHEKTFDRKADAERYGIDFDARKIRGEWTDPQLGKVTFEDWCGQWQRTIVNLRPKTVERDLSIVKNHLLPRFGNVQLAKMTTTSIKAWVAEWNSAGTHAPATVRKAGQVLSKILAAAVDEGMISRNPTERVSLPAEGTKEMRFLSVEELHDLVRTVGSHYGLLVWTAALTGLRFSELAGLKVKNVDVLRQRLSVVEQLHEVGGRLQSAPLKTKASKRTVAMPPTLAVMLGERLGSLCGPDALVFVTETAAPLRGNNFRSRVWRPTVARAGLGDLRFHDLRHTAVALAVVQGAHAKAIQVRMGHTSITTTLDRYGHLFPELDADIGDGLESVFVGSAPEASAPVVQLPAEARETA